MKPLKLTMRSFGSYGSEPCIIDFQNAGRNLFLITGDTGAGKTTIFDGIVFALYGEAGSSVNKKDGEELQSQYAPLADEPFVELEFSKGVKGEDVYTVRRVPKHKRPLKRGKGEKNVSASVSLIMPDGSEYPSKEADRKLEEIVGLTKHQFMQTAMIAQGEFMELLRAKSDDKKVIFRRLFHTQLYQNITDELGRRKKEQEKEIAVIKTICQTEAAHVRIPPEDARAQQLKTLQHNVTAAQKPVVTDLEQFLEELKLLCGRLKQDLDKGQQDYAQAGRRRDALRDAYVHARNLQKFFDQMEKAEKELRLCQGREAEMQEKAGRIVRLQDAYEIQGEFQRYADARRLADDIRAKWNTYKDSLPGLLQLAREAAEKELQAKETFHRELESFSKTAERAEKALKLFEKIELALLDAGLKKAEKERAAKKAQAAAERLSGLEQQEQDWRRQAEGLSGAEKQLALWNVKKEEAAALEQEAAEAGRLEKETAGLGRKVQETKKAYAQAAEQYDKASQKYEADRRLFLDMQAGFLAKELRPGKPCPVCGSLQHPKPCVQAEGRGDLSRERIEALEQQADKLRRVQEKLAAEAKSCADLLTEKETVFKRERKKLSVRLQKSLNEKAEGISIRQAAALIADWKQQIQKEGVQLKENALRLEQLQKQLQGMDEKKNKCRTAVTQAQELAAKTAAAYERSLAAAESLKEESGYPTADSAGKALDAARQKKEAADGAYQKAKDAAQDAAKAADQAKTLIQKYEQELPRQVQQKDLRRTAYEKLMEEKQLSEADWKLLTDQYEKKETGKLQAEIDAYHKQRTGAESMLASAKEAVSGRERPDPEAIKKEMDAAEEKRAQAEKALQQLTADYKADADAYAALAPRMEERARAVEKHAKLDTLYRLVSGNVTGSRMDLETYVQRYYMERILYAANRRFREMSAGQFELRMYALTKAGEGRNRGLDLMVYSAVTGKEREIRTLSGGESFMAALSLALGMADQIRENSAAVSLDMMFVDEGFGSLDEHSRNQAVKVLQKMAGGSKLIGIISHVTELKQEIEDQLLVSKDALGSHIKWQIN